MAVQAMASGLHVVTTAGPENVQVGFIPDVVKLYGLNTTLATINIWIRMKVVAFTSGGTTELKAGDVIQGATSVGVRADIQKVALTSGSWAAGTAAGYLFWQDWNQNGALTAENVDLIAAGGTVASGGGVGQADVATLTAAPSEIGNFVLEGHATPTSSRIAYDTPANAIQPYSGTIGGNSEGFTITADLAVAGEVWYWEATRGTLTL